METLIGLPVLVLLALATIVFLLIRRGQKNKLAKLISFYADSKSNNYQLFIKELIKIKCSGSLLEKKSKVLAEILVAKFNEAFSSFVPEFFIKALAEIFVIKSNQRKAWLKNVLELSFRDCPQILASVYMEVSMKEATTKNKTEVAQLTEIKLFLRWVIKRNRYKPDFIPSIDAQIEQMEAEYKENASKLEILWTEKNHLIHFCRK